MKITIEKQDTKFSIEIPDEANAVEVCEAFSAAMFTMGYHPDTIKEIIDYES